MRGLQDREVAWPQQCTRVQAHSHTLFAPCCTHSRTLFVPPTVLEPAPAHLVAIMPNSRTGLVLQLRQVAQVMQPPALKSGVVLEQLEAEPIGGHLSAVRICNEHRCQWFAAPGQLPAVAPTACAAPTLHRQVRRCSTTTPAALRGHLSSTDPEMGPASPR